MKTAARAAVFAFFFSLLFLQAVFSQAAYSQDFSSLDSDLSQLESEGLIAAYGSIIQGQGSLLRDLQKQPNGVPETYRKRSALPATYEKSSRRWWTFTLVAIPAAAAANLGFDSM